MAIKEVRWTAGAKALRQGYAPCGRNRAVGEVRKVTSCNGGRGEGGQLWLLLWDGKLLEGFEQRSVTLSDLYFNRSILAADLRIDIRKTREETGKLVRRLFITSDEKWCCLRQGWGKAVGKMWLNSGYIVKAGTIGLADQLHVECDIEREESRELQCVCSEWQEEWS